MSDEVTALLQRVRTHVHEHLRPQVQNIDHEGLYPEPWLRELGVLGGFAALASADHGGSGLGLATQLEVVAEVAATCGSTAFTLWSQGSCAWYLRQTRNAALRQRYLPELASGRLLAGSGLSNTVKHLVGVERSLLRAQPDGAGYRVSGSLPWVSNLGPGHVFGTAAQRPDGGHVAFLAQCDAPGIALRPCPEFCGLEGTRTLNVRFADVHVDAVDVLAPPADFAAFVARIQPGFILLQVGMAVGIVQACLKVMAQSNRTQTVTNAWLDDQPGALERELADLRARGLALAEQADAGTAPLLPVLETRLQASELALRAAQSAALHAGARGYLRRHDAQRLSREALFLAIVTPALKQLRRDIARLRKADAAVPRRQGAPEAAPIS